ncbi:hypothetical protein ONZ45_g6059 [Pleurotus djamor]|nr:hypothetical protein ONZ45_g6059 [Pleurotus djamor]
MHDLAIPLIYKNINTPPHKWIQNRPKDSPTWVELLATQSSRHIHFTRELKISSSQPLLVSPAFVRAASKVVSDMRNLKRLRIYMGLHSDAILQALTANITLTHLSCMNSGIAMTTLRTLLTSQQSLEILLLDDFMEDPDTIVAPLIPLPQTLHTFGGCLEMWNFFEEGIKLQHLCVAIDDDTTFQNTLRTFRNLRTLSIRYNGALDMIDIAPFLDSIECISLTFAWGLCDQFGGAFELERLSSIPSTKFVYFSILEIMIRNHSARPSAIFAMNPSLKIIDHTQERRDGSPVPKKATRYIRDAPSPVTVRFPALRPWEAWWDVYPNI